MLWATGAPRDRRARGGAPRGRGCSQRSGLSSVARASIARRFTKHEENRQDFRINPLHLSAMAAAHRSEPVRWGMQTRNVRGRRVLTHLAAMSCTGMLVAAVTTSRASAQACTPGSMTWIHQFGTTAADEAPAAAVD